MLKDSGVLIICNKSLKESPMVEGAEIDPGSEVDREREVEGDSRVGRGPVAAQL